jgi:hypothetical protein
VRYEATKNKKGRDCMTAVQQRTGTISTGDVTLFYRVFGAPGRTPILIIHGSNYYDSYDWIDIQGNPGGPRRATAHSVGRPIARHSR